MAVNIDNIDFSAFVRSKARMSWGTVSGRPVEGRSGLWVQFEENRAGTISHRNVEMGALKQAVTQYLTAAQTMTVWTEGRTYEFRRTKKGTLLSRSAPNDLTAQAEGIDRAKRRVLTGVVPALVEAGVMNAAGQIYADKHEKFRQIDRFTQLFADVCGKEKRLTVVDFGCGKSYLDFCIAEYCRAHGIEARLIGVDRRADVVETSRAIAAKCGLTEMTFVCGDVADCPLSDADVMVSLHACDTATDYALYNAVSAKVKYVLAVPCCQHELNAAMTDDSLLSRYGLLRERAAALVTDAVRAALLESCGYRVQVLEYVDSQSSLKNVMLRAVFADLPHELRDNAKAQAEELLCRFGAKQTLYELLYGAKQAYGQDPKKGTIR